MPYFQPLNFNNEDEEKAKQNQISGASNVISGNSSNQGPTKQNNSGLFTNLNQYLDANKENAQTMGSTITGNVDQQAQDASNKINQFKTNAPSETQAKSADDIKGMLDNASTTDKNQYKTLKNTGGYSGPDSYDKVGGYDDASQSFNKADNQVKNLKSEEGRQNLLADTYKRPNYTQGQKTFDNLLLQNDPNSKKMFEDTSSKWSGLNSLLDSATSEVGNRINTNKQTALANKQLISGDGTNKGVEAQYIDDFINPIEARKNAYNTDNPEFLNRVKSDIDDKDGLYSQETIDALTNLGLKENDEIFDLDFNNYFTPDYTQAQLDNVASQEERAKWAALQNLLDGNDSRITADGKAANPYSLDKDKFGTDLATAKSAREASDAALRTQSYSATMPELAMAELENANVDFGTLQNFIDSGKSARDFVAQSWRNPDDPIVQAIIARMEADKAALNTHNLLKKK